MPWRTLAALLALSWPLAGAMGQPASHAGPSLPLLAAAADGVFVIRGHSIGYCAAGGIPPGPPLCDKPAILAHAAVAVDAQCAAARCHAWIATSLGTIAYCLHDDIARAVTCRPETAIP